MHQKILSKSIKKHTAKSPFDITIILSFAALNSGNYTSLFLKDLKANKN